jgi:hypothetical protein
LKGEIKKKIKKNKSNNQIEIKKNKNILTSLNNSAWSPMYKWCYQTRSRRKSTYNFEGENNNNNNKSNRINKIRTFLHLNTISMESCEQMVHAANHIEKEKNKEGLQHQPLLRRAKKKKTIEMKRQWCTIRKR